MNDLTLESLAKRVEALERIIATNGPGQSRKDWRRFVGMFRDASSCAKPTRNACGSVRPNG